MNTGPAEQLWFLDTLVTVCLPGSEGHDGICVMEHRARYGDSPPLHVHISEDEVFRILEGELRLRYGEQETTLQAGCTLLAARGIPHTYRVESPEGARWLTITCGGDFERFVRALSRPAQRPELPPPAGPPTPEAAEMLTRTAHEHNLELVGPPLH